MNETMQLVVGWTLVGAFVFTVLITCGSLVGWVRFADQAQQKKLFSALIVELVLGVGTSALDMSRFDPTAVETDLLDRGSNQAVLGLLDEATSPRAGAGSRLTKKQANHLIGRLRVQRDPGLESVQKDLRTRIQALPEGELTVEGAKTLRPMLERSPIRPIRVR